MGYSHQGFLWGCSLFVILIVLVSGSSSSNLPIIAFDEGYTHLFGDDNLMVLRDGKSVRLTLNERTGLCSFCHVYFAGFLEVFYCAFDSFLFGWLCVFAFAGSGFVSQDLYLHGFFSASIKLPADYTAGVVVAFYVSDRLVYLIKSVILWLRFYLN